jgi:hypothetical protein
VPRTVAVLDVALDRVEARQEVVPLPPGGPGRQVLGFRAEGDAAVRRRRAADAAPASVVEATTVGLHLVPPVVGPAHRPAQEAQLVGKVGGAVVRSGLEQQDAPAGILGKSGREHAPRRAAADDDRVGRPDGAHRSSVGGSSQVDVTRMWAPR